MIILLGNEFKSIRGKEEAYCIMETGIKGVCLFRKTVSLYFLQYDHRESTTQKY